MYGHDGQPVGTPPESKIHCRKGDDRCMSDEACAVAEN